MFSRRNFFKSSALAMASGTLLIHEKAEAKAKPTSGVGGVHDLAEDRPFNGTGDFLKTVALAMQLIEAMASSDEPCRLTDLAGSIGTSKARVFRHLRTLATLGYVAHDGDSGRYRIGSRLAELGATVANHFDLARIGRPIRARSK